MELIEEKTEMIKTFRRIKKIESHFPYDGIAVKTAEFEKITIDGNDFVLAKSADGFVTVEGDEANSVTDQELYALRAAQE